MKYAIGLDFGTGSVRAVVAAMTRRDSNAAGSTAAASDPAARDPAASDPAARDENASPILAAASVPYAVLESRLPTGAPLKPAMALADPAEYRAAMVRATREALLLSGVRAADIAGIACDTTSCSLVALDRDGTPLCETPRFRDDPHAFIKLWKSHSAEREARLCEDAARARGEAFLPWVGDRVSSEWLIPKALETFRDAPDVFAAADLLADLPDYITFTLCGEWTRNVASLCYKALAHGGELPSALYLDALAPGFSALREKLRGRPLRWGERAGRLTRAAADALGLPEGIAVGGGTLDGNIPVLSLGLEEAGDLLLTFGTSGVLALVTDRGVPVRGVAGVAMDAFLPDLYGCEAGMAAMGDLFQWAVENLVPARYARAAEEAGVGLHEWMSRLGLSRPPALSDPLALDWWNGHRGPLRRMDVRGAIMGLSLASKPEDLYRALVESTAFCVRMNLENIERQGVPVKRIFVCGGIARKNPLMMRLFADVLGRELPVSGVSDAAALGAAITAAAASDAASGSDPAAASGSDPAAAANAPAPAHSRETLMNAARRMRAPTQARYAPRAEYAAIYDARYRRFRALADAIQSIE